MINFKVIGKIVSYKNPILSSKDSTKVKLYTPKEMKEYQQYIGFIAKSHMQVNNLKKIDGATSLKLDAFFSIPKTFSQLKIDQIKKGSLKFTKYPDLTNILKLVEDALKNICFLDDKNIVKSTVSKNWCKKIEEESYLDIEIENNDK